MTKAVIFDVDGTLVDSNDVHAEAWQQAFHDFGHEIGFAEIRAQIGKGGDQLMPMFLSEQENRERGEALDKHRSEIFKTRYLPQVKGFPQVRALFQRLLADGRHVALASSAKGDELGRYKQVAQISDLVEAETSADDADHSKPSPDIFQAAMDRLPGIPADEIIVVGDTPYDAEAASRSGLRIVGVCCGGWSAADLLRAGCIETYPDIAALLHHYARSALAL